MIGSCKTVHSLKIDELAFAYSITLSRVPHAKDPGYPAFLLNDIRKHLKQRPLHCSWPHCKPAVSTLQQNRSVLSENELEHDHQTHTALCCHWSCMGHVSCFHSFLNCTLSSSLTNHSTASGPYPDVMLSIPQSTHVRMVHSRQACITGAGSC